MKPAELKRILARKGAGFLPGKGSHLKVRLGGRQTVLPMHNRDMPTGTLHAVLKELGLTRADLES
ncbi:MAG: type II toxin-antitoxin system HicA family toxin [Alphaproteobacteria bacterium]|nr:type II toxin-antitoxin system HicA family toxin [Alphaproteobacteria bacterium]